jgi:hypothetical protein
MVVKIHLVIRGMTGLLHLPIKNVHTNLEIDIQEQESGAVNVRNLITACRQKAKRIPSLRNLFQIFRDTDLAGGDYATGPSKPHLQKQRGHG